jgi:hypothetical protein
VSVGFISLVASSTMQRSSPVIIRSILFTTLLAALAGCGSTVDVTKTAKGFRNPTDPNSVEVFYTRPDRKFVELGAVSTSDWDPADTAKLHNALRAKAAPLGADGVIILNSGLVPAGWGKMEMWCTAVAIQWQEPAGAMAGSTAAPAAAHTTTPGATPAPQIQGGRP